MTKQPTITGIPVGMTLNDLFRVSDTARSKADLQDWTGCPPMHLNKEPIETGGKHVTQSRQVGSKGT